MLNVAGLTLEEFMCCTIIESNGVKIYIKYKLESSYYLNDVIINMMFMKDTYNCRVLTAYFDSHSG